MGSKLSKREKSTKEEKILKLPLPGTSSMKNKKSTKSPLRQYNSLSEFNFTGLASSITHRFSVLSGLSFISFVAVPNSEVTKRPRSRVSRKRFRTSTLLSEYAQCKTVWPVPQTEALFLPEFSVGIEEKLKLILLGEIGRGAFGQVFHVRCAETNKEYAMKVLSKAQVCSLGAVQQVKQEVMIQHVCGHHPFITPIAYFWQSRKLLIVMTEYVAFGELQQLWRSLRRFPEELWSLYVAEIAISLDFLHNAGIIFRDLKMENILLDKEGHIKLIDFGLARWLSYGCRTKTVCGTLQYMAPEVLSGQEYGHNADWWSLGIIAYSLLAGHYPISGHNDHLSMKIAVDGHYYTAPENVSKAAKCLVNGLLQKNPSLRIHTLNSLQREEIYMKMDFDAIRDRKISPRTVLESYIDGKSRRNFDDFAGLASTPKKASVFQLPKNEISRSPLMGNKAILWDRARRSSSTPLLSPLKHPPRLGHHDALIKSVSITGYNGAAVPLLQSPLLRLARGNDVKERFKTPHKSVSVTSLPTAVSPLLVNLTGNRKFIRNRKSGLQAGDMNKISSDVTVNRRSNINRKHVYEKSFSESHMQPPCLNSNPKNCKNDSHRKGVAALDNTSSEKVTFALDFSLENVVLCENDFDFSDGIVTSTPKKRKPDDKLEIYESLFEKNEGVGVHGSLLEKNESAGRFLEKTNSSCFEFDRNDKNTGPKRFEFSDINTDLKEPRSNLEKNTFNLDNEANLEFRYKKSSESKKIDSKLVHFDKIIKDEKLDILNSEGKKDKKIDDEYVDSQNKEERKDKKIDKKFVNSQNEEGKKDKKIDGKFVNSQNEKKSEDAKKTSDSASNDLESNWAVNEIPLEYNEANFNLVKDYLLPDSSENCDFFCNQEFLEQFPWTSKSN